MSRTAGDSALAVAVAVDIAAAGDDHLDDDDDILENPCPICFENEDDLSVADHDKLSTADQGSPLTCYSCGFMICGKCNTDETQLLENLAYKCPQCTALYRSMYDIDSAGRYKSGWKCLNPKYREPGRHTRVIQHGLGLQSLFGKGTEKSVKLGIELLSRAARAGYGASVPWLLAIHRGHKDKALGFERNLSEMSRWSRFQAESLSSSGRAADQYTLAMRYNDFYDELNALAGESNVQEAVRLFRLAADQGHAESMYELGRLYRFKRRAPYISDEASTTALHWYRQALNHGHLNAAFELGELLEIEDDHLGAHQVYLAAAMQGHAGAAFQLAQLLTKFASGSKPEQLCGLSYDFVEAMRWWHESAERGFMKAQLKLGYIYMYETHRVPTIRNPSEASKWFRRAAEEHQSNEGCFELGNYYARMLECGECVHFWTTAACRRHNESQVMLWKMYTSKEDIAEILPYECRALFLESKPVLMHPKSSSALYGYTPWCLPGRLAPVDPEKAFRRCKMVAVGHWEYDPDDVDAYESATYKECDSRESIFILGCMHFCGYGTPKDVYEASRYWTYLLHISQGELTTPECESYWGAPMVGALSDHLLVTYEKLEELEIRSPQENAWPFYEWGNQIPLIEPPVHYPVDEDEYPATVWHPPDRGQKILEGFNLYDWKSFMVQVMKEERRHLRNPCKYG